MGGALIKDSSLLIHRVHCTGGVPVRIVNEPFGTCMTRSLTWEPRVHRKTHLSPRISLSQVP